MGHKHLINLISDSTDETLIRYSNLDFIHKEIEESKKLFKKYKWPVVDITRKSIEETAAAIIEIFDIKKGQRWW